MSQHEKKPKRTRTRTRRRKSATVKDSAVLLLVVFCGALSLLLLLWTRSRPFAQVLVENTVRVRRDKREAPQFTIAAVAATFHEGEDARINNNNNKRVFFSQARTDRSGAVLQDMLLAHAYAFQQNQTYGGACATDATKQTDEVWEDHSRMIEALGLRHVLQFACPTTDPQHASSSSSSIIDRHLYTRFGTRIWTPEWLQHIRSQQQHQQQEAVNDPYDTSTTNTRGKRSVVAHIRRGDVDLCDSQTSDRYLTNQHYLNLLAMYADNTKDEITIYSEQKSTESWDDFRQQQSHYNLQLDQPPVEAWRAMMQADVLILSKSSFSIVPALFNRHGVVVYTPFWVQPLPHWRVVDDDTDRAARRAALRLRRERCA